jgi:hypothetical protein
VLTKYYVLSWVRIFIEEGIPSSRKECITQGRETGETGKNIETMSLENEETVSINDPIE